MSRYIDEHRGRFGVEPICRTLDVSASACCQRAKGERSARPLEASASAIASASCKTELIADRVWRSRSQVELAVVE